MIAYKNTKNMGYLFHQKKKEGFCMKKKLFKTGLILMSGITIGTALLPSTMVLATDITQGMELKSDEQPMTKEEAASMDDGLLYTQEEVNNELNPSITPRLIINDGQWNWKKIGTDKYNHKRLNDTASKLGGFLFDVATVYFGGKVVKKALTKGEFSAAVAGVIVGKVNKNIAWNKTIYYTVTTYEDKDSRNYYVKKNVKGYSDAKRTKLIVNENTVHKFTKK